MPQAENTLTQEEAAAFDRARLSFDDAHYWCAALSSGAASRNRTAPSWAHRVTARCQSGITAIALISIRASGEVILATSTIVDAGAGAGKYSRRTLWMASKCSMLRT
jgi:hypothetical protein